MMNQVTAVKDDGFRFWSDYFAGGSISEIWSKPVWISNKPKLFPTNQDNLVYEEEAGLVRDALTIDTTSPYTIEYTIVPYNGEHYGEYKIFAKMDNTSPDATQDGVIAVLKMIGEKGQYQGTLYEYSGGTETSYAMNSGESGQADAGWFRMVIDGNNVKCYWNGNLLISQDVTTNQGQRFGFGMTCTKEGGVCLIDTFRAQYFDGTKYAHNRTLTVASAGGKVYKEDKLGDLAEAVDGSTINIQSDRSIEAVEYRQKILIADYGEIKVTGDDGSVDGTDLTASGISDWTTKNIDQYNDVVVIYNAQSGVTAGVYEISGVQASKLVLASDAGTGNCSYRIERGPKIFDPKTNTLSLWVSTKGSIPVGCKHIGIFNNRAVLANNLEAPHVFYACRQNDIYDWDYGADGEDPQRAFAGSPDDNSGIAEPITGLIPHDEDFIIIGCTNSIWRVSGDPAYGGRVDPLSHDIGLVSGKSWTKGPNSETIFMSRDGFYLIPPGGNGYPQNVSHPVLPSRLKNIDIGDPTVLMEYDVKRKGINLFITTSEGKSTHLHWWFDWDNKSFWPEKFAKYQHNPTALMYLPSESAENTTVLMGCQDGYIRRFNDVADTDDGETIEADVLYGPMLVNKEGYEGTVKELVGVVAEESRPVQCALLTEDSAEALLEASPRASTTLKPGINRAWRPRRRAAVFAVRIGGDRGYWSIEGIRVQVLRAGKQRLS
jgi:hypothetical protein